VFDNVLNRRGAAALATVFCLLGIATSVEAQQKPADDEVTATVLALEEEGEELVLDLGAAQGAVEGALVEIWRPLKLKHPVSGKLLTDRFKIGTLQLGQVRPAMSLARANGALTRTPEKGDLVILRVTRATPEARPTPVTPPTSGPPSSGNPPTPSDKPVDETEVGKELGVDAEAQAIATMFDRLKGADLVTRIRKYEDYVRSRPEGRYARVLYEEAASLRRLLEADGKPAPKSARRAADPEPVLVNFKGPESAVEGTPLDIVVELSASASGAVLHVRQKGKPNYTAMVMSSAGPGYWSARVPGERLGPAEVEYFIEATSAGGVARPVVGLPASPSRIEILDAPRSSAPRKLLASAVLLTDFADYNGLEGNDQVWQTEGYFSLRYGDTGVRALRSGFGIYRGKGGSLYDLDTLGLKGRDVGLTYGYLETEIGAHRAFSIIGRLAIGLLDSGISGGGQILFRIGNDRDTNLVLGGELLGGVGLRGFTQLELNTFKRVPILIRTEVTNQPAGAARYRPPDENGAPVESTNEGEVGARGIVQVGYRFTPGLVVAARVSFQGRTINHAGPGFGGAVGYEW
jgi:hypothetical protein